MILVATEFRGLMIDGRGKVGRVHVLAEVVAVGEDPLLPAGRVMGGEGPLSLGGVAGGESPLQALGEVAGWQQLPAILASTKPRLCSTLSIS